MLVEHNLNLTWKKPGHKHLADRISILGRVGGQGNGKMEICPRALIWQGVYCAWAFNPFPTESETNIDFTLANARRFYLTIGDALGVNKLKGTSTKTTK